MRCGGPGGGARERQCTEGDHTAPRGMQHRSTAHTAHAHCACSSHVCCRFCSLSDAHDGALDSERVCGAAAGHRHAPSAAPHSTRSSTAKHTAHYTAAQPTQHHPTGHAQHTHQWLRKPPRAPQKCVSGVRMGKPGRSCGVRSREFRPEKGENLQFSLQKIAPGGVRFRKSAVSHGVIPSFSQDP
jgi:hypothetical protein